MALFNLLVKSSKAINWPELHTALNPANNKCVTLFPIPSTLELNNDFIGITVSGEYETNLVKVNQELLPILEVCWSYGFTIIELYNGEKITFGNYVSALNLGNVSK